MVAFERESGDVIKDMFVGESPSHVMTAPAGSGEGNIYLAMNGEEQVTVVDPNTFEIIQQISTGPRSHPHGHWVSSDGSKIVTPDFIGLKTSIIDLEEGTVTSRRTCGWFHPADCADCNRHDGRCLKVLYR